MISLGRLQFHRQDEVDIDGSFFNSQQIGPDRDLHAGTEHGAALEVSIDAYQRPLLCLDLKRSLFGSPDGRVKQTDAVVRQVDLARGAPSQFERVTGNANLAAGLQAPTVSLFVDQ
jgi:hypothetical protein